MKKFMINVLAAIVGLAVCTAATAQTVKYQDAEQFARAYLRTKTTHYVLLVGARPAGTDTWLNMEYTMDARTLRITNFNFYGTNVPLLKPLPGLPIPTNGYQDFNLSIIGYDAARNQSCHGYMYTNMLVRGDSIAVTVLPEIPSALVSFTAPDPNEYEMEFDGASGGYYYDWGLKGFVVRLNDSLQAEYTIRHRVTKEIPAGGRGVINVFEDVKAPSDSPVNVRHVAGIVEIGLSTGGKYTDRQSLPFDSVVTRDDQGVPAKVLMVRDIGRRWMYMYVSRGGIVEVRRPEQNDVLPMRVFYRSDKMVGYSLEMPLDDARVTVFPNDDGDETFDIYIGN